MFEYDMFCNCGYSWTSSVLFFVITSLTEEETGGFGSILVIQSTLVISNSKGLSLKYFEISVVRHIRFAELRKK